MLWCAIQLDIFAKGPQLKGQFFCKGHDVSKPKIIKFKHVSVCLEIFILPTIVTMHVLTPRTFFNLNVYQFPWSKIAYFKGIRSRKLVSPWSKHIFVSTITMVQSSMNKTVHEVLTVCYKAWSLPCMDPTQVFTVILTLRVHTQEWCMSTNFMSSDLSAIYPVDIVVLLI